MKTRHGSNHRSDHNARNSNLQDIGHTLGQDTEDGAEAQFPALASGHEQSESPQPGSAQLVQSEQLDHNAEDVAPGDEQDEQEDGVEEATLAAPTEDATNPEHDGADEENPSDMAPPVDNSQWPYGRKSARARARTGAV